MALYKKSWIKILLWKNENKIFFISGDRTLLIKSPVGVWFSTLNVFLWLKKLYNGRKACIYLIYDFFVQYEPEKDSSANIFSAYVFLDDNSKEVVGVKVVLLIYLWTEGSGHKLLFLFTFFFFLVDIEYNQLINWFNNILSRYELYEPTKPISS